MLFTIMRYSIYSFKFITNLRIKISSNNRILLNVTCKIIMKNRNRIVYTIYASLTDFNQTREGSEATNDVLYCFKHRLDTKNYFLV